MHNTELGTGKIYVTSNDGSLEEIGIALDAKIKELKTDEVPEEYLKGFDHKELEKEISSTFTFNTYHIEWHKKKKGKRYVYYPIKKSGFSPKLWNILRGFEQEK